MAARNGPGVRGFARDTAWRFRLTTCRASQSASKAGVSIVLCGLLARPLLKAT
jgi:hypothetical protein